MARGYNLSIHFNKGKAKSILFASKHKIKMLKLNIIYEIYIYQTTFKGHILRLHIG